ncbi:subtilisin-like protease SBT3 [Tasmannia lanceolata]|uniref:subtilisin-like protease SBT3 n=1 Tax=Tasmannia lanceolata TaxID=3420 RepID=UPI004062ED4A
MTQVYITVRFICAMNFTKEKTQMITRSSYYCSGHDRSLPDLNYPSFIAYVNASDSPSATRFVQTFRRIVTNIEEGISTCRAKLTRPIGFRIKVSPTKLVFGKKNEKLKFTLTLESRRKMKELMVHGSLSWVQDEGANVVRSPIVVTTMDFVSQ